MKLSKKYTKSFKPFSKALLVSAIFAASTIGTTLAQAETSVDASVGISNAYLWRGLNFGNGSAAVYGDLVVSSGGAYAGVWASSGDDSFGTEYDLFVGYGGEVGNFFYDIYYASYVYSDTDLVTEPIGINDFTELLLTVGYGPVSVGYYDVLTLEGDPASEEQIYITASVTADKFTFTYGQFDQLFGVEGDDRSHFDVSYAFNDNLSFTYSTLVEEEGSNEDPIVVFNLNLPIE